MSAAAARGAFSGHLPHAARFNLSWDFLSLGALSFLLSRLRARNKQVSLGSHILCNRLIDWHSTAGLLLPHAGDGYGSFTYT